MLLRYLLLAFGVLACSTAVIMINLSTVHPLLLAGYRCLVAAVALSPLFVRDLRRHRVHFGAAHLRRAVLPGLLLGVHFASWIVGARLTPVAHASLIVNMVPLAMPFFLYVLVHERLTGREALGTVLALSGVAAMTAVDFRIRTEHFTGDIICLASMLFFCAYLVLGRRNRDFVSIWLYLVPLYFVAGALCVAVAAPFVNPIQAYPLREVLLILGLGIVPTVIGHSVLNYSMKHMRGQRVGIANLGQMFFVGIMGYFILGQVPAPAFYVAAVLLAVGIAVAFSAGSRRAHQELPGPSPGE